MKKLILKLLIGFVVVIVILFFSRNLLIKLSVESLMNKIAGLELKIEKLEVGLTNSVFSIDQLLLFNPKDFKDRIMLNAPEIYVQYDLTAAMKRSIHLPELRLNVAEFVVIKDEKGRFNLDTLKSLRPQGNTQEKIAGDENRPFLAQNRKSHL